MARHRKPFCEYETVLDLSRQGFSVMQIARHLNISTQTVYRRFAGERDRLELQERLALPKSREEFEVVVTLQYGHRAKTRRDKTATKGILCA